MSRRARGSVYRRESDGRWCARLLVRDVFTGRKKPYVDYAASRDEADVLLARMITQNEAGTLITETMRFDLFSKRWLLEVKKPSVTQSAYDTYCVWWNTHIAAYFKDMALRDITPATVHDWQHKLLQKGKISDGYIRSLKELLGQCFRQAEAWGLIARNPATPIKAPRRRNGSSGAGTGTGSKQMQVWTPDEVRAFLTAMQGHPHEPLYAIALMLGLRLGELLGLRWQDIDFDALTITVSGQWTLSHERTDTKSHRTRVLDMPRSLATLLRAYKQKRVWEAQQIKRVVSDGDYVFARWDTGLPPTHDTTERRFKADSSAAKMRVIVFHGLRHSCASYLYSKGVPILTISKILGHANPQITMSVYTHIFGQSYRDAADAVDDLLGGVGG
jgi:integrase